MYSGILKLRVDSIGVFRCIACFAWAFFGSSLLAHDQNTWDAIQDHIFAGNCTSCHSAGTSFERQSGLDLTAGAAFSNLVDVPAQNQAARDDGLLRVSSNGGLPGLAQSFLWEKINVAEQDHFYDDHPGYGSLMPMGLPPLTNGELEFIKNWIVAGAPETGIVANENLLNDDSRFELREFAPLEPPQQGIQLHLEPFDVWPAERFDREVLFFEPHQTTEDLFVNRYEVSYRDGSHHFILFNYPDGKAVPKPGVFRDLRDENGTLDRNVANEFNSVFPTNAFIVTQEPYTDYSFPPGVALRLPSGSGFDLNVHSVNRSEETINGEVFVNLYTVDRNDVEHVADFAHFSNTSITLPPQQVTTISREFTFSETQNVIQLWSHSHEHTTEFKIERVTEDGDELIYWTHDWEHPPILQLDPPLTFKRGDRVRLVTTYDNDTDRVIRFGPYSSDEMQFMFYIYYKDQLKAGDADRDLDFDQLDLVRVQIAGKYLTGNRATWGEGDWNGTSDGDVDRPPRGDRVFDQLDIIAALSADVYLTGPYGAITRDGIPGDSRTSLVYHANTGELSVDAPAGNELTSINITSEAGRFTGDTPAALDGAFDNFAADNVFKATFGGSFGSISFGEILPPGISEADLTTDLSAVGSLAGGGDLGEVDLIYIPEPTAAVLILCGLLALSWTRRRHR